MSLFDTGIRPAIDDWLLAKSKEERDYGDYWSASSAGYCMRRVIFERLKIPYVTEDARKQRVFTSGHLFHEWIQGITKQAGLSIAQELELQDEDLMIRGHIDDLVLVSKLETVAESVEVTPSRISGTRAMEAIPHLILYDYKTQNSRAFSYKRDEMSYYHKMQLGTYMYMLRNHKATLLNKGGLDTRTDLTEARILKISKDDLRMSEEQLLWSDELESEVKNYWALLNTYWANKEIPECTCADHENGFLAREAYNPYFYNGEPCSLEWYKLNVKEKK